MLGRNVEESDESDEHAEAGAAVIGPCEVNAYELHAEESTTPTGAATSACAATCASSCASQASIRAAELFFGLQDEFSAGASSAFGVSERD